MVKGRAREDVEALTRFRKLIFSVAEPRFALQSTRRWLSWNISIIHTERVRKSRKFAYTKVLFDKGQYQSLFIPEKVTKYIAQTNKPCDMWKFAESSKFQFSEFTKITSKNKRNRWIRDEITTRFLGDIRGFKVFYGERRTAEKVKRE